MPLYLLNFGKQQVLSNSYHDYTRPLLHILPLHSLGPVGLQKCSIGVDGVNNPRQTLQWRHNGRDDVSNHQPHNCLLNRLFRCRSKKTPKLRVLFPVVLLTIALITNHYNCVTMRAMASQITSLTIVYSTVDERKHQSSASLAFVKGIHRWPVNSQHNGPVARKMFPFDDVIMMHDHITWRAC